MQKYKLYYKCQVFFGVSALSRSFGVSVGSRERSGL